MPIVSRSQLSKQLSDQAVPVVLLAAICASALSYVAHDSALLVSGLYDHIVEEKLWDMVYRLIQIELRAPRLVALQASLLYLQRVPDHDQWNIAETPSKASFRGSTVALAMSLGLHLECRPWGIPSWEKRLRRRLWWAVYLEDKWTSLLLGRPPMIRQDEWDVLELDEADFEMDAGTITDFLESPPSGVIFPYFIKLALLAECIHQTF